MNAFDSYKNYLALKRHFDGNYDYFKYCGKIKAGIDSFEKRKDRHLFIRLSRQMNTDEFTEFCVANLIRGREWIGNFNKNNWNDHKKITQGVEYFFSNDIEKLLTNGEQFDKLFIIKENNHPKLIKAFLGKKIHLETLVILERLVNYKDVFDKRITETFIWPDVKKLIEKYDPFLTVNMKICKNMLLKTITRNL